MTSPHRARAAALAGALGLAVLAGACGGDSDSDTSAKASATPAGKSTTLTIKDFAFTSGLKLPMGTVVKVKNSDDAAHTATADDGTFDTGNLAGGETKEITLSKAGEIAFHCAIHDYMRGVIQVTA